MTHQAVEGAAVHAAAAVLQEEGALLPPHELGPGLREVRVDGLGRRARERHVSVAAALAAHHAQHPLLGVDVVGRQVRKLGAADAGGVEGLEDGPVAQPVAVCVSGASRILRASSFVRITRGKRLSLRGYSTAAAGSKST